MQLLHNPIPTLDKVDVEALFTNPKYGFRLPDPNHAWNKCPLAYTNLEVTIGLEAMTSAIGGWRSAKAATNLDHKPLLLGLLKGCGPTLLYVASRLGSKNVDVATMKVSTYDSTNTAGKPVLIDPLPDVRGRDVLIVDDMGDTFRTEERLKALVTEHGAKSVVSCVMLVRKPRGSDGYMPDFAAIRHDKERPANLESWLVGWGLDGLDDPFSRSVSDSDSLFVIRYCPKKVPDGFEWSRPAHQVDLSGLVF